MRRRLFDIAATTALALSLSACSHGVSPLPQSGQAFPDARSQSNAQALVTAPAASGPFGYTDIARRSPGAPVNVTLTLRYNNEDDLDRFLAESSDPQSSHYGETLTPEQFNARYGPTAQQEAVVLAALRTAGFTIAQRFSNRTLIDAVASSSVAERFFATQIHDVRQGIYGTRYVNVTAATIPAAIAPMILTASMNDLIVARTPLDPRNGALALGGTPNVPAAQTPALAPIAAATNCNGAPPLAGPLQSGFGTLATGVAQPFDFPVQHGCSGKGYTGAIVIDTPPNLSYLKTYLSVSKVTQTGTVTTEKVDGGGNDPNSVPEAALDTQTLAGLAPGANIIVYDIASLNDGAIEDGYNKIVSDNKSSNVNSSFSGCESTNKAFETSTNAIAKQGAAIGIQFSASSGDDGPDCYDNGTYISGVGSPAGDPYFTSVGGVDFRINAQGQLLSVTAGSASCGLPGGICHGGGGVSTVVALPYWQKNLPGAITTGRNQPDISLPFYPVAVYVGQWATYLGTSWSSPASVALFLEANQFHHKRLGWVNGKVYSLFKATGYADDFTPCTSGSNGGYSCSATEYNQAAGIGVPKGWALAQAL